MSVTPLSPEVAEALALIHAAGFPRHPRPWSAPEIAELMTSRGSFLIRREGGFLIGRSIADEAELLTVAVAPDQRRKGIGAALIADFAKDAASQGAAQAFLEVASDNAPAQALYAGQGWEIVGRRRNYYAPGIDALILSRALHPE